jgi:hypothetical protein
MLSVKLIQMIEDHADELMIGLMKKLRADPRTPSYHQRTEGEVRNRAFNVYKNLGAWMLSKSESEIKAAYEDLGAERFREGVPLHEVIQALILTKQHLIEFIRSRGLPGTALEIFGELELRTKANQFFDSAIYFMAAGYDREQAKASSHDHRAA